MRSYWLLCPLILTVLAVAPLQAQNLTAEQLQVGPPPMPRAEPSAPAASAEELEQRGDELRMEKDYVDALDYYREALRKKRGDSRILNKAGIVELQLQNLRESRRDFESAIKHDPQFADAYNNLGVIFYEEKKYGKAIDRYERAIKLRQDSASFYSNLGAVYFCRKEFDKATQAYSEAAKIDPDIFEHSSHNGIAARMSSPEDRAHFDYVLAGLFAKAGDADRALLYLRRAMEEGYKGIDGVFKDEEFAAIRKDARFTQLMASRPPAVTE